MVKQRSSSARVDLEVVIERSRAARAWDVNTPKPAQKKIFHTSTLVNSTSAEL